MFLTISDLLPGGEFEKYVAAAKADPPFLVLFPFPASWQDHARDLLQMVNHFRAEIKRPIVGVAHSMGACNLVDLALMHPRLFTTLVLLEPAIAPVLGVRGNWLPPLMSAQRRDTWPSRALARQMFLKNPFYRRWDARVLDRYVSHGLRDLPTRLYPAGEGVTLTTPRDQEVLSFLRPNLPDNNDDDDDNDGHSHSHRRHQLVNPDTEPLSAVDVAPFYCPAPVATFHRLPALRPSVLYIIGTDTSHRIDEKLAVTGVGVGGSGGAAERRVKHVQLRASHFLPFEAEVLSQATSEAARWIADEMELWRQFERQRRQVWDGLPSSERQRMARGALEVLMKGPPRGKGNMASL